MDSIVRTTDVQNMESHEPFKIGRYVSKASIKHLKNYYDEYVNECQDLGFVPCTLTAFIVDMTVVGYLHSKEKRRFLKQ